MINNQEFIIIKKEIQLYVFIRKKIFLYIGFLLFANIRIMYYAKQIFVFQSSFNNFFLLNNIKLITFFFLLENNNRISISNTLLILGVSEMNMNMNSNQQFWNSNSSNPLFFQSDKKGESVLNSSVPVRLAFLRKVYGILSVQLAMTTLVSAFIMFTPSFQLFMAKK